MECKHVDYNEWLETHKDICEKGCMLCRISELEQENARLWKLLEVINEECELGVCKASEIARQALEGR